MTLDKVSGNTLKTAKVIKPISNLSGSLSSKNSISYYSFRVSRDSRSTIKLEGLTSNADLALLDSKGKLLRRSNRSGKQGESITSSLKSGDYVLQVVNRGKATSYQLKLSSIPVTSKRTSSNALRALSSTGNNTTSSSAGYNSSDLNQLSSQRTAYATQEIGSGAASITELSNTVGQYPQISGSNVVWQSYDGNDNEIFFYNGSTVTQLTNNSTDDRNPQVSGSNVVWQGYDGIDNEIFLYNGNSVTQLTNNTFFDDSNPQISGSNVVWEGFRDSKEIFFYNGSTAIQLTNNNRIDEAPQVSGSNVVWRQYDGAQWDILLYNGSTSTPLSGTSTNDGIPKISGSNVVWRGLDSERRNELYFYNGSTVAQLTNNSVSVDDPQISGSNVVWEGDYSGDIFFYNGSTVTRLDDNGVISDSPQISGSNITWQGDGKIWFYNGSTVTQIGDYFSDNSPFIPQISGSNIVWIGRGSDGSGRVLLYRNSPPPNTSQPVVTGLNSYLSRLDTAFSNQVLQNSLPLIGGQLKSSPVSQFIGTAKNKINSAFQAVNPSDDNSIRQTLFNALGNEAGGLNILQDLNSDNTININDIQISTQSSNVEFRLKIGQISAPFNASLAQDLGLPKLGLSLNGNTQAQFNYGLSLKFGYQNNGSGSSDFYVETSDADEFSLGLNVATPGLNAVGNLGILKIKATDQGTNLASQFSIDLKDSNDAGSRLTLAELQGLGDAGVLTAKLTGKADVKLNLATNFPDQAKFPSLSTDFRMNWSLNSASLDPNQSQTLGGVPKVEFRDVKLDMGTFMGNLLSPILQRVNDVTQPIRSITDKLTTPIAPLSKLLKRDVNFFDIAKIIGKADPDFKLDLGFIEAAANLVSIAGKLPNANGTSINFGNLVLNGVDVRSPSFNLSSFNPVGGAISYTGNNSSAVQSFVNGLQGGQLGIGSIGLPILTDATAAFKLLLGNPNVTLIDYKMPTLNVDVTGGQTVYIIGPIGVRFEGTIGAKVNLKVGFDTAGLFKYSTSNNATDIFEDGLFLDSGVAPLTINAGVSAGPAIDLGALARATVQGGLLGTIDFNWRDDKNPNDPNKVRLSELSANLGSFNMFSVSGQLDAAMKFSAFVIGLGSYELPLGAVALYPAGATPKAFPEKSQNKLPKGTEKLLNLPKSLQQAASKLGVEAAKRVFGPKTGPKLVNALSKLDPTRSRLVKRSGILDLATGNPAAGTKLLVQHGPAAVDVLANSNAGKQVANAAKAAVSAAPKAAKQAQKQLTTAIKQTDKALSSAKKTAQKPAQVVKKAAPIVKQVFSPRRWSRW